MISIDKLEEILKEHSFAVQLDDPQPYGWLHWYFLTYDNFCLVYPYLFGHYTYTELYDNGTKIKLRLGLNNEYVNEKTN